MVTKSCSAVAVCSIRDTTNAGSHSHPSAGITLGGIRGRVSHVTPSHRQPCMRGATQTEVVVVGVYSVMTVERKEQ